MSIEAKDLWDAKDSAVEAIADIVGNNAAGLTHILMRIAEKLDRIETHLYHIEKHCRPESDEPDDSDPRRKERTL